MPSKMRVLLFAVVLLSAGLVGCADDGDDTGPDDDTGDQGTNETGERDTNDTNETGGDDQQRDSGADDGDGGLYALAR